MIRSKDILKHFFFSWLT